MNISDNFVKSDNSPIEIWVRGELGTFKEYYEELFPGTDAYILVTPDQFTSSAKFRKDVRSELNPSDYPNLTRSQFYHLESVFNTYLQYKYDRKLIKEIDETLNLPFESLNQGTNVKYFFNSEEVTEEEINDIIDQIIVISDAYYYDELLPEIIEEIKTLLEQKDKKQKLNSSHQYHHR